MNINLTFFGEMLTFGVLIFITLKYIWPPVMKVLQERQQKIADGLEAAERARKDLDLAQQGAKEKLFEARSEANSIIANAQNESAKIIDISKSTARDERDKILLQGRSTLEKEKITLKQYLEKYAGELGISLADKILQEKAGEELDHKLVDKFIDDINEGASS